MEKTSITVIIIKPDATAQQREEIKKRFLEKGLAMLDCYSRKDVPRELFESHYKEHKGKDFFNDLIKFMSSGHCFFSIWSGVNAVEVGRKTLKEIREEMRNPKAPLRENLVHASDSRESARSELELWFPHEQERYKHLFRKSQ